MNKDISGHSGEQNAENGEGQKETGGDQAELNVIRLLKRIANASKLAGVPMFDTRAIDGGATCEKTRKGKGTDADKSAS